jgi:hypothetical protein
LKLTLSKSSFAITSVVSPLLDLFTKKYKALLVTLHYKEGQGQQLIKALKWIRENIGKFAGDKSKVTLLGKCFSGLEVWLV